MAMAECFFLKGKSTLFAIPMIDVQVLVVYFFYGSDGSKIAFTRRVNAFS
jgi:hypothetical protein